MGNVASMWMQYALGPCNTLWTLTDARKLFKMTFNFNRVAIDFQCSLQDIAQFSTTTLEDYSIVSRKRLEKVINSSERSLVSTIRPFRDVRINAQGVPDLLKKARLVLLRSCWFHNDVGFSIYFYFFPLCMRIHDKYPKSAPVCTYVINFIQTILFRTNLKIKYFDKTKREHFRNKNAEKTANCRLL